MLRSLFTGTILCLLAISCNNQSSKSDEISAPLGVADTTALISSDAAKEKESDSAKFIRTADIRFKVSDVQSTTKHIEDIVRRNNGYVAYTHLASTTENTDRQQVSKDSSLAVTYYTVSNTITIRVPNYLLDTTLREIGTDVVFLDHRTIKADDVSIQYLANSLGQQRYGQAPTPIVKSAKQKDLNYTRMLDVERKEKQDEYFIANKYLDRDVRFSVVTMELYQSPSIQREMLANPVVIAAYRPSLLARIGDNLIQGWYIFEDLLVFITRLWSVVLIAVLGYIAVKAHQKRGRPNRAALRQG